MRGYPNLASVSCGNMEWQAGNSRPAGHVNASLWQENYSMHILHIPRSSYQPRAMGLCSCWLAPILFWVESSNYTDCQIDFLFVEVFCQSYPDGKQLLDWNSQPVMSAWVDRIFLFGLSRKISMSLRCKWMSLMSNILRIEQGIALVFDRVMTP